MVKAAKAKKGAVLSSKENAPEDTVVTTKEAPTLVTKKQKAKAKGQHLYATYVAPRRVAGEKIVRAPPGPSTTKKAGLTINCDLVRRKLIKHFNGATKASVTKGSAVYMAAVLEYMVVELIELSGNAARDNKRKTINNRHVFLAARNDNEIGKLLKDVDFAQCGVVPHVHSNLLRLKMPRREMRPAIEPNLNDDL